MIKRLIEEQILSSMTRYPSVTIYGPRQCGKTTTVRQLFPSFSYANLEDRNTRNLALQDPYEFFNQFPEPVIIDEIQTVPSLLGMIQVRIDAKRENGRYVLTGSQQIKLKEAVSQSLAGRTCILHMLPLSLKELQNEGVIVERDTQLLLGGYPYIYTTENAVPNEYYRNYVDTYIERDISKLNQIHNLLAFESFLQLLAGRCGSFLNVSSLSNDSGISSATVKSWISILEATGIIYLLKPYFTSRTSHIVKTPKLYFTDTGLLSYLLNIENPKQMFRDPLRGSVFENLIVTEALKAKLDSNRKDNLFFYRNSNGVEVDIIDTSENSLEIYEIKSGSALDKDDIKNMQSFSKKYPTTGMHLIYSGEDYESFNDVRYINFHNTYDFFAPKEDVFKFNINGDL